MWPTLTIGAVFTKIPLYYDNCLQRFKNALVSNFKLASTDFSIKVQHVISFHTARNDDFVGWINLIIEITTGLFISNYSRYSRQNFKTNIILIFIQCQFSLFRTRIYHTIHSSPGLFIISKSVAGWQNRLFLSDKNNCCSNQIEHGNNLHYSSCIKWPLKHE